MTPAFLAGEPDIRAVVAGAMSRGSRPDPALLVSEWADKNRILTSRSSPEPGLWRTSRTPYLKEPMDCLSPSHRCEMVVLMKGAQVGATEMGNNWIGYNIAQAPGPMLAVQPTVEMSKRNSKQRIGPLIEECPALSSLVKESRSRDSGNTILSKEFPGGILVMTGANSAKGLRSMSARYLFLDEVDGYVGDAEGEGEPCALAIARTTNYARRKIFIASTPVVTGRSRIERFYETSDQCQYFVPCPMCMEMQPLTFEGLRWEKGNPESVYYECVGCRGEIFNHSKNYMLPRGEWRPAKPGSGRVRGFHLSSLYSPVGWLSWTEVIRKYEECGADPIRLQVFWNTVLGLPWADQGEVPDADRLFERREDYQIGQVPEGGLVLTAGADVQYRRIEVEIVAWGRAKQSWSVDYRVLEGDTSQPKVWRKLGELLEEEFLSAYGGKLRIQKVGIDAGFNPMRVYEFCRERLTAMAIKGNTHTPSLVGQPSVIDIGPMGHRLRYGARLWPVNVSIAKEVLYRWLKSGMPDLENGEPWPIGYCHFPRYSRDYFDQLTAEHLVTRVVAGGFKKSVWEKRRERNEALDARVYAMAAMSTLRLDTWAPERWDDLQESLTVRKEALATAFVEKPVPKFQAFGPKESRE